MFYSTTTNTYINEGHPFSIGDIQYPANWLNLSSASDKEQAGLVEVVTVGERADDRYNWVSETLSGNIRTITNIPKDPDMIAQIESNAAQAEITRLETQSLLPRLLRAYLLTVMDANSEEYKKVKEIEDQIVVLRKKVIPGNTSPML